MSVKKQSIESVTQFHTLRPESGFGLRNLIFVIIVGLLLLWTFGPTWMRSRARMSLLYFMLSPESSSFHSVFSWPPSIWGSARVPRPIHSLSRDLTAGFTRSRQPSQFIWCQNWKRDVTARTNRSQLFVNIFRLSFANWIKMNDKEWQRVSRKRKKRAYSETCRENTVIINCWQFEYNFAW